MLFKVCQSCGASLDPGEVCDDCAKEKGPRHANDHGPKKELEYPITIIIPQNQVRIKPKRKKSLPGRKKSCR